MGPSVEDLTVLGMITCVSGRLLERVAVVGESPVRENTDRGLEIVPE